MGVLERLRQASALEQALAIFALALATIVGAWIFEALGYAPCDLCLKQRIPYYTGIPLAALAAWIAARGPRGVQSAAFFGLALIFAASAIFGVYHSGVEWGFWPGPDGCTGAMTSAASTADFLKQLQTVKVVRCDAVAIRIFGLSLAGWNAVISSTMTGLAVMGLRK